MFFLLVSMKVAFSMNCQTDGDLTTGYSTNFASHFAAYESTQQSDVLIMFIGQTPGQTSFFYEHYANWKDIGHNLFVDVGGAGYSRYTQTISTVSGLAQLYANAYVEIKECLPFTYTKLYVLTGGIMSLVAMEMTNKNIADLSGMILLSPIIDIKQNMNYLPQVSFNMGLIDFQERMKLESYNLARPNPSFEDYLILVNSIVKLSGDMQAYDYRKYEVDTLGLKLSNDMNTQEQRQKYQATNQFFFTQGIELYNSLLGQLNKQIDAQDIFQKYNCMFFLPQFSLNVNIPGTLQYFYKYINSDNFKLFKNENGFPLFSKIDSLYIIYDSGDRLYIDQLDSLKELIQQKIK